MCTSVAILERGRIVAAGSVDAIGRGLTPDRGVKMRLLGPPEDVEARLGKGPSVLGVERDPDGSFRLKYAGGDEALAEIVAFAVKDGLRIVRLEPDQNDLERIFLEVTKGELQ
jgi:ABC-2 type transport system ATP-binding protein